MKNTLTILAVFLTFSLVGETKPKSKNAEIRTALQVIFNNIPALEQNVENLTFDIMGVENTDLISPSRDDQHVSVNPEYMRMRDTSTALAGVTHIVLQELYKIQNNLE
jgi:hypothetical protein